MFRRGDQPYKFAKGAIDAYAIGANHKDCAGIGRVKQLMRAVELAREINAKYSLRGISDVIKTALRAEFHRSDADQRPGIILRLLRLLILIPGEGEKAKLHEFVNEVSALYSDCHPSTRQAVIQHRMMLARGDAEKTRELQSEIVQVWIEWADRQDNGLLRRSALSTALEHSYQLPDAEEWRKSIQRQMQLIREEDLGFQSTSVETEISAWEIEETIRLIVGDDSIESALNRFGAWGC